MFVEEHVKHHKDGHMQPPSSASVYIWEDLEQLSCSASECFGCDFKYRTCARTEPPSYASSFVGDNRKHHTDVQPQLLHSTSAFVRDEVRLRTSASTPPPHYESPFVGDNVNQSTFASTKLRRYDSCSSETTLNIPSMCNRTYPIPHQASSKTMVMIISMGECTSNATCHALPRQS